jgi:nucleoside-diphosphate-sugar epimerase
VTRDWTKQRVLVTGGASFIGSHLVDRLVAMNVASLRVVDDLSTGTRDNLEGHLRSGAVELVHRNLFDDGVAATAMGGIDVVFHLAAIHGGRGFIDTHQAACAENFALDGIVFRAARQAKIAKLVFTSSGCVYPMRLQQDVAAPNRLAEHMVGPPYDADGTYGWAKLMGELTLAAYARDLGFACASCRLFTVYGERCTESHALIAMISRAFLGLEPFEVWGTGEQIRNWTYVSDIIDGLVLAAERIDDGSAVNLGTEVGTRVGDAAHEVLALTGHRATIAFRPDMPTGPLARVADSTLARERLGWIPRMTLTEGLQRTIRWYYAARGGQREQLARELDRRLLER